MSNLVNTKDELNRLTSQLIELGLSDDQNYAIIREVGKNRSEVTFEGDSGLAYVLKNNLYTEIYSEIKKNRDYNVSLPDGGIIQMQYIFQDDEVVKHRLGFFPSPDLSEFQNEPEVYMSDLVYAEIVESKVVTTPFRFDFDLEAFVEGDHPRSHVTIGQYKNCRIPMRSAVSPFRFVEFILGSFYNTAFRNYRDHITGMDLLNPQTITDVESRRVHFSLQCR